MTRLALVLTLAALAGCATPEARLDVVEPGATPALTFAVLTDTHVGEGHDVYLGQEDAVTARLRAAVEHVNDLARERGVAMVFVLGDLTGSAERAEFQKARELLDGLEVPYYPLLGNHDVWPYTTYSEAFAPSGDRLFSETFHDRFEGLDYTGAVRVRPLHRNHWSQFQNFALHRDGFTFFGLDWNSREHALITYPGAHPQADLHAFPGGTLPWLQEQLAALPRDTRRVFFLQHHPFRLLRPVPDFLFGFDGDEKEAFRRTLTAAHGAGRYGAVFAGHLHREATVPAFDEWLELTQIETAACKETSAVTLVELFDDGTYSITRSAP